VESAYTDLASRPASGEIYTSAVVGWLLESGLNVGVTHLQISDIHVLGTPIQVKIFAQQAGAKSSEPMRVCFDIDETLLHRPQGAGYEASVPIEDNVALARYLKSLGHTIVLYTARRMRTHQGNVGSVIADIGKLTVDSLDRYEIPYDEIYFGKPYAHVYIDDLAVSAYSDLEKELGFYDGFVGEREFNQIESVKVDVLRKSSENASILGEMYYYENIPKSVSDLFPRYFGSDGSRAYLVEKLDGMSVSHLFVKEALTVSDLGLLLRDIRRIHESQDMELADSSLDIYANYRDKVVSRYTESVYGPLGDSASTLYSDLLARLGDYHDRDRGVWGVIHGDPVFTNILRCANARYKFIDMRGQLGETLTIWGDRMYDYAKIYQSLIGYDEILLGRSVGDGYRRRLLDVFEDHIHNALPEGALSEVQTLTASLLFSLIPLHIESRRPHFLRLACECAGSNS
jgi:capsule biosynthesis phosphatase